MSIITESPRSRAKIVTSVPKKETVCICGPHLSPPLPKKVPGTLTAQALENKVIDHMLLTSWKVTGGGGGKIINNLIVVDFQGSPRRTRRMFLRVVLVAPLGWCYLLLPSLGWCCFPLLLHWCGAGCPSWVVLPSPPSFLCGAAFLLLCVVLLSLILLVGSDKHFVLKQHKINKNQRER